MIDRAQRAAIAEPTKEVSDLNAAPRVAWLMNAAQRAGGTIGKGRAQWLTATT
jgi:hypothetical protein